MSPQSFSFVAGEDLYIPIPILDDADGEVDLVGVTARFVAGRATTIIDSGGSTPNATVTVGSPEDHMVLVQVADTVTDALSGTYDWELKLFGLAGGERVACFGYMTAKESRSSGMNSA